MFFSFLQQQTSGSWIVVRSNRDPGEISNALERTVRGLDPSLPLTVRTWNHEMSWALFAARVASVALGVLGMLGAMLAVTGIFGMASYTVSKRLRELGIRMALGAQRRQVLRTALGRAFILLSAGSFAGLQLRASFSPGYSRTSSTRQRPTDPGGSGRRNSHHAHARPGRHLDSSPKSASRQPVNPHA